MQCSFCQKTFKAPSALQSVRRETIFTFELLAYDVSQHFGSQHTQAHLPNHNLLQLSTTPLLVLPSVEPPPADDEETSASPIILDREGIQTTQGDTISSNETEKLDLAHGSSNFFEVIDFEDLLAPANPNGAYTGCPDYHLTDISLDIDPTIVDDRGDVPTASARTQSIQTLSNHAEPDVEIGHLIKEDVTDGPSASARARVKGPLLSS